MLGPVPVIFCESCWGKEHVQEICRLSLQISLGGLAGHKLPTNLRLVHHGAAEAVYQ